MTSPNDIDHLKDNLAPFFGYYSGKKITELILQTTPKLKCGRKRMKADKVKNYSFSLHPDLVDRVSYQANVRGVTRSQVIRELIERFLPE